MLQSRGSSRYVMRSARTFKTPGLILGSFCSTRRSLLPRLRPVALYMLCLVNVHSTYYL